MKCQINFDADLADQNLSDCLARDRCEKAAQEIRGWLNGLDN